FRRNNNLCWNQNRQQAGTFSLQRAPLIKYTQTRAESVSGGQQLNHSYESIVFDLFHTIVDPEEFRPKSYRRAELAARALNVDLQSFTSYWSNTLALRNTDRCLGDLIKAEPNQAKVPDLQGSGNAPVKCHLQRLILVTSRLSKQSPSMSLQGTSWPRASSSTHPHPKLDYRSLSQAR